VYKDMNDVQLFWEDSVSWKEGRQALLLLHCMHVLCAAIALI